MDGMDQRLDHQDRSTLDLTDRGPAFGSGRAISRAIWAFVALGVALRVGRLLLDFPLWWDEAFVAVNFLRRGFLDLLEPLDYGQVCPLLFLWVELAVVQLLGFDEWTLRLFPALCAVVSVVLFRHAAGRVLSGLPLLLAVAIFAVSFHPIRHAADVKPYASDLLVSLVLLTLALEWWRTPQRVGLLWLLAAVVPLALAASHPAVFVAGGLGLALAPAVWRTGDWRARSGLAAMLVTTLGSFLFLYFLFTRAQAGATLSAMQPDWEGSFPPLADPLRLLGWFLAVHAGHLMAYPCGGGSGASLATLCLVLLGAWYLARRDRGALVVAACLAPLGMALVAAALRRYPYGGSARFMQYAAPGLCLLAGQGAAVLLERISRPATRRRALRLGLASLAAIGIVPVLGDLSHPYRSYHAHAAREFAQQLWPELARTGQVACARWDAGVGRWNSIHLDRPVYLCNQAIYGPHRQGRAEPATPNPPLSETHPLRYVLANPQPEEKEAIAAWLASMRTRHDLRSQRTLTVSMSAPGRRPRPERYDIYEFVPRSHPVAHHPGARDQTRL